jgi:pimeloyl-ACP methyl ester carboxylesterase
MRRLVVTGYPCSEAPWRRLFPEEDCRILTLAEVMERVESHDLRRMADVVQETIQAGNFRTVIAHDIGVTTTILALLRLLRRNEKAGPEKLVLFNGAFSHFSVFEAPHPLRIQLKSAAKVKAELARLGVEVDPRLMPRLPAVKKMYRLIIAASIEQSIRRLLGRKANGPSLPVPTLILEGVDDPFIPRSSIDGLERLFSDVRRVQAYVGHFPYQDIAAGLRSLIDAFDGALREE